MPPLKKSQDSAPAKPVGEWFVADESFACVIGGQPYNVSQGERVRAGHPLLKVGKFTRSSDLPVQYEWETR